jgi:hypothetical protein
MQVNVHLDHHVPFLFGHLQQRPVTEDAGVVDEDVEPAVGVEGRLHHLAGAGGRADRDAAGDGSSPQGLDLGHDSFRGSALPGPISCAAEVVDDHLGPFAREQQGMGAPDPAPCTRDDGDLSLQTSHVSPPTSNPRS